jgi:hypothetical protein
VIRSCRGGGGPRWTGRLVARLSRGPTAPPRRSGPMDGGASAADAVRSAPPAPVPVGADTNAGTSAGCAGRGRGAGTGVGDLSAVISVGRRAGTRRSARSARDARTVSGGDDGGVGRAEEAIGVRASGGGDEGRVLGARLGGGVAGSSVEAGGPVTFGRGRGVAVGRGTAVGTGTAVGRGRGSAVGRGRSMCRGVSSRPRTSEPTIPPAVAVSVGPVVAGVGIGVVSAEAGSAPRAAASAAAPSATAPRATGGGQCLGGVTRLPPTVASERRRHVDVPGRAVARRPAASHPCADCCPSGTRATPVAGDRRLSRCKDRADRPCER